MIKDRPVVPYTYSNTMMVNITVNNQTYTLGRSKGQSPLLCSKSSVDHEEKKMETTGAVQLGQFLEFLQLKLGA